MTSDTQKEAVLVKTVFGGEKGEELIKLWKERYKTILLSSDREQSALVGTQMFIQDIEYFLSATSDDLKKMDQSESYEDDNF